VDRLCSAAPKGTLGLKNFSYPHLWIIFFAGSPLEPRRDLLAANTQKHYRQIYNQAFGFTVTGTKFYGRRVSILKTRVSNFRTKDKTVAAQNAPSSSMLQKRFSELHKAIRPLHQYNYEIQINYD